MLQRNGLLSEAHTLSANKAHVKILMKRTDYSPTVISLKWKLSPACCNLSSSELYLISSQNSPQFWSHEDWSITLSAETPDNRNNIHLPPCSELITLESIIILSIRVIRFVCHPLIFSRKENYFICFRHGIDWDEVELMFLNITRSTIPLISYKSKYCLFPFQTS